MIFGLTNGRLPLLLNYIQVNNSRGLVWHPLNPPVCRHITRSSLPKGLFWYFFIVLANTGPEDFTDAELGAQRDRMQNDKKNCLDTGYAKGRCT